MFRGRLGAVQRLEDRHRKYYCVMNDVAKHKQENTVNYIRKEKQDFGIQREKSMAKVRQKFAKRIALQKCLQENRIDSSRLRIRPLYGHYNGRSLQSFSKDIDIFLAERHPKIRKKKICESLLEEGQDKGKIMGSDTMTDKIKDYMTETWGVKYAEAKKKRIDYFDEELVEQRRKKAAQKLPPIFSLYKISLKPLEHCRRDSYVQGSLHRDHHSHEHQLRNQICSQSESEIYFRKLTRRERLEQLAQKVACTKPACAGYQGDKTDRSHDGSVTLPTIDKNSFLVRQISG
ncbi:hypothetical protein KP79_PYT04000 [Mizuhopecten yessoensis]|uniref:Uncharacterized protein n=1 Tax=Mizuhopecten yessoensis TaxID=6573 RepID=A0A210QME5_MIZYE|nr:hypothetical protein KP79_PYT04000 [Mizuhopecten yessoensis]